MTPSPPDVTLRPMRRGLIVLAVMAAACGGPDHPREGSAPVITSAAPADATEDELYRYAPIATDDDGEVAWRQTAAHTCGGTVDATTGEVVFTPTGPVPPASCTLAIEACDRGMPVRCTTQTAAVTIRAVNDAPAITGAAPDTATEDVVVVYRPAHADPDGPGSTWALLADHTCGGQLDAVTGELQFAIAGPTPPSTCTLAMQVCDGGTPDQCATQRQELAIVAANDPPLITSGPPALATEDIPYTYQATVLDQDGPAVTWSLLPGHTCGGTIDSSGLVRFTIAGPIPPSACQLAIEVCDAGAPLACTNLSVTIPVVAVDDAPQPIDDGPTLVMQNSAARTVHVLINDLDPDAGPRTVGSVTAPGHGTAQVVGSGAAVQYAPAPGYCNSQPGGSVDTFTYRTAPGAGVATVSVRVMCPSRPTAIAAGASVTCTLFDSGIVRCWGLNAVGQLGLGDTVTRGDQPGELGANLPPVDLGAGRRATAIAVGAGHACAILDGGAVKCWGANAVGQLGLGDTNARGDQPGEMGDSLPTVALGTGRTAVAISAASGFTCVVLDNGAVKCWGGNVRGRLGLGDTAARGDGPGEMGDDLPAIELGTGRTAVAIGTASDVGLDIWSHACALLDDGAVKCWGVNDTGQLGLGDTVTRGDQPGEMGDSLPSVQLGFGRTAIAIAIGGTHSCAHLDDGAVKCWGANDEGQLGLGDDLPRGGSPAQMGDALLPISLGSGRIVVALSAGDASACVRFADASVTCWGYNFWGRLGLGDQLSRGNDPGEMGDALPAVALGVGRHVRVLAVGPAHQCVILDDDSVKCWGFNSSGELGYGDVQPRGLSPGQMGDNLPVVGL